MSRHRNKAAQSLVAKDEWPVTSDIRVPIVSDCLSKMQVAVQRGWSQPSKRAAIRRLVPIRGVFVEGAAA